MINISRWYLVHSRQGYLLLLLLSIPPKMSRIFNASPVFPKIPKSVHPNPRIKEKKERKRKHAKQNTENAKPNRKHNTHKTHT